MNKKKKGDYMEKNITKTIISEYETQRLIEYRKKYYRMRKNALL